LFPLGLVVLNEPKRTCYGHRSKSASCRSGNVCVASVGNGQCPLADTQDNGIPQCPSEPRTGRFLRSSWMTARTRQHRAWDSAEVGRALKRSVRGAEEKSPKRPPRRAGRLRCPLSRFSPRAQSAGRLRLGGGSAVSAAKSHGRRMRPGSSAGAPRPRSTHRAVTLNALRPRWGNDPNGLEWTAEAGSRVSGCQLG